MEPIWSPSPERIAHANLTRFMRFVRRDGDTPVQNLDALANPQALDFFKDLAELRE